MLTRRGAAALVAAQLLALTTSASGQDDEPGSALTLPERLTVGVRDQFLGQLAPDHRTIYFLTNRNTRVELFKQDIETARPTQLFDEGADVTWPRISPDGKALAYVSFRDQASGELCVRDLPAGDNRRCLTDASTALQAEWLDARRLLLTQRTSIDGDLRVSEVTVAAHLSSRVKLEGNVTSPAVSPDGRWLVYVPLGRVAHRVGPAYAASTTQRLEAVRLDTGGPAVPMPIDLPGVTGQPAFSRDGRWLYFVQFFADSNHDGVIDANDHGVLFRVPFDAQESDAPSRAASSLPDQLTEASWNCQYPAPASDRLVATCARHGELEIYTLPLGGQVPADWTVERLRAEIELGSEKEARLLLYRQRLGRETTITDKRLVMTRLALLHLDLGEHDPAEFYVRAIQAMPDPATAGLARTLLVLVAHRRAAHARLRGRAIETFADDARGRLEQLREDTSDSPAAVALKHVVRSEIADGIADKSMAKRELEATVIDDTTPRAVIDLYFRRADALYRLLDDRESLVAVGRKLSANKGLDQHQRLTYARAATRAITRGRPYDEADTLLARERASAPGDDDYGFALDLERALLAVRGADAPTEARDRLIALYGSQQQPDRRRAIAVDAMKKASEVGADRVLEAMAERYVDDVPPGSQERHRAEALYRRALVGRAFRRAAQGRLREARADFDAVARRTGAFEAVAESIELRIQMGEPPEGVITELEGHGVVGGLPLERFARAYLIGRSLPDKQGEEHTKAVAEAVALLRASWPVLKGRRAVRALYGSLMHQEYLRTGAPSAVEAANYQYLIALGLVQDSPRYRAMILGQLGLLHVQANNHRIALGYLEKRDRLPYNNDAQGLAVRLALARTLLHAGRDDDAAQAADKALEMISSEPSLARFRVLGLDRAALYHLAAGRFERALALYDQQAPLLTTGETAEEQRNRVVLRLARATAAIGAGQPRRALDDLALVDAALADPGAMAVLTAPHANAEQAARTYHTIAAGLRANADSAIGHIDTAAAALERYRTLVEQKVATAERTDDLRALTLVELRLADNAKERRDFPAAARWLARALEHGDRLVERTHGAAFADQVRVLWFGASLSAHTQTPAPPDLRKRLEDAHQKMLERRNEAHRSYERWFEIYLGLLSPGAAPP